jgi:hypothetical protein
MRRRPRSSVRCDERTGSLFVIVGYTCTRELFGHEPDLQFVPAQDVANQQVIGSIVAARAAAAWAASRASAMMSSCACNKRNNCMVASSRPRGTRATRRCLGNIVSHGDGDSAEGLNAFGQHIDKLSLLAVVLVEEKVELVKRRPGDLPMVFLIHIAQGHCVGENLIEAIGAGQANLVIER